MQTGIKTGKFRRTIRKYRMILIVAVTLFITFLHYSTIPRIYSLHAIYKEFYYIPIFLGALVWGLRGAGFIYLMVLIFDVPFIAFGWSGKFLPEVVRLLHLILQGFFALLAGFISEREKKARERAERARYLANIGLVSTAIVHDLKNPLITILGFARRLQEGKGDADAALKEIAGSAQDMQKIVNDVLDFSKPVQLELKKEDIRKIITRACDFCRVKAEAEAVELLLELPEAPLYAGMDGFHMERALVNIISNSIEASKAGQRITVGAAARRHHLVIRIRDEGSGMDPETLKNIFVPFYTRKKGGTGLGMPIAQKVIEGHRGSIEISSSPGAGTDIKIELPYKPER
ncbi:MAG: HAMP domain-containing sensor histidine kinase [Nitrospiraceae bacterium]|nr:HAMP domain-containing sensor histidine kinase [Nitrospiraceae bacterium]